jgi:transposase-like protein
MTESTLPVHHWTPARKAAVAMELLCCGDAVGLARKHGLSQAELFAWRERFRERGQAALKTRRGGGEQGRLTQFLICCDTTVFVKYSLAWGR